MEFVNHTPFPAIAFEGIDQHARSFHVVALRQTLTFASGQLEYADRQAPLCEVDTFFGEMNESSVRQENDLCQYKPKCDIIVNATAYAPQGKPTRRFRIKVRVQAPSAASPLPEEPQGMNPLQASSHQQMQAWREATARAQRTVIPGKIILDKTLVVTGERTFRKYFWPLPMLATLIKWSTLGLIKLNHWRLTMPKPLTILPLRYEYAYGGQCRINANDKAARRVVKKYRLTPAQLAAHPSADAPQPQQPVAHSICERNLAGRGFAEAWHLNASRCKQVPAPSIEHPDAPITAGLFWQAQRGKFKNKKKLPKALEPAGLGVRAKVHPQRRTLLGTIDDAFIQSDAWLPQDFDFSIWNAAPVDQQTEPLRNDETIELVNLCTSDTPGARIDAKNDTVLKLALPKHECFVLLRMEGGEMVNHPLSIDTVIIEPDEKALTLVWRTTLTKDKDAPIRVCEARMHTHEDRDGLQEDIARITNILQQAKQVRQARQAPPLRRHPAWDEVTP